MSGVPGFDSWYEAAQAKLKVDHLAPLFIEIRNNSEKRGISPLDRVTLDHLHEHLFRQRHWDKRSHVIVLPDVRSKGSTVLRDAAEVSRLYFTTLVDLIYECYDRFRFVVDPQWYFTEQNFSGMGKTLEDALFELGFPPSWFSAASVGDNAWRALRLQHPGCLINDIFQKYVGRKIAGPDEVECE